MWKHQKGIKAKHYFCECVCVSVTFSDNGNVFTAAGCESTLPSLPYLLELELVQRAIELLAPYLITKRYIYLATLSLSEYLFSLSLVEDVVKFIEITFCSGSSSNLYILAPISLDIIMCNCVSL